jgi:hypothetical protein
LLAAQPPAAVPDTLEMDEVATFVDSKMQAHIVTIVNGATRCIVT